MEIKKVNLPFFTNEKHFEFQTFFKNMLEEYNTVRLEAEVEFEEYYKTYIEEKKVYEILLKSDIPADIIDYAFIRDAYWWGLENILKLAHTTNNRKMVEVSKKINRLIAIMGNVPNMTDAEFVSASSWLIQRLRSTHKEEINALSLDSWLSTMEVNNTGIQYLIKLPSYKTWEPHIMAMRKARIALDDKYEKLTTRINKNAQKYRNLDDE